MKVRPSVIIEQNDKILTLEYKYNGTQVLALPGGNLEFGESIQETLIRELNEELGVHIEINYLKYIAEVHGNQSDTLHMVFYGEIIDGIPIINKDETTALNIKWLDKSSLTSINLYPNVAVNILENNNLSTEFLGEIKQEWF